MADALLELAPDLPGVLYRIAVHPQGRCTVEFVSDRARDLFGLEPDPATILDAFRSAVPPADLAPLRTRVAEALQQRAPCRLEGRFLRTDGAAGAARTIWWRTDCRARARADGSLVFSGLLQDVTSERLALQRAEHGELRYEQLIANMTSAFALHEIVCDAAGQPQDYRFLEVNPAFERLTGLGAAQLLGRTVREVWPQTEDYWIRTFGRVALEGVPLSYENYSRELGRWYDACIFSPQRGRFAAVFYDVSARRAAELALQDRESLLSNMAANSPGALLKLRVLAGRDPELLYAGGGLLRELGVAGAGDAASLLGALGRIPASELASLRGLLDHGDLERQACALATPFQLSAQFPLAIDGGAQRWCQAQAQVEREGPGFVVHAHLADISEQHRAERLSLDAAVALEANQAKTRFLSRMSHELRTPLNAVLGYAQLLQIDAAHPLQADQARKIEIIRKSADLLLALIDDVLNLTRIEEGGLSMSVEPVDLFAEVAVAVDQVRPLADRAGVALEVRAPEPASRVLADRTRLEQVLANLLTNAIKYNRPGGRVAVEPAPDPGGPDQLGVCVVDTGMGMSAQQLAQLFVPFNRLGREHSGIEGTGIGLTIVQRLLELMQGSIGVDSEPGVGTRCTVWLQAAGDVGEPAFAAPPQPAAGRAQPVRDLDVLYVEDNEVNRLLIQESLPIACHARVRVADSGAAALAQMAACVPDLLLMDLHLGDMTAIDLVDRLRETPALRALPRMLLTADAFFVASGDMRRLGCLACLHKPVKFAELARAIEQFFPGVVRAGIGLE